LADEEFFKGIDDRTLTEKETDVLKTKYQYVFTSTDAGVDVLCDILVGFCNFGQYLETPKEVAEYNVGISILSRLGIASKGKENVLVRTLVGMMPQPIKSKEE